MSTKKFRRFGRGPNKMEIEIGHLHRSFPFAADETIMSAASEMMGLRRELSLGRVDIHEFNMKKRQLQREVHKESSMRFHAARRSV
ncbi:MAG: hypothetical protein KGH64_04615 [Candidatus Micrarchaeota archaeon]|nr:hypothetical protein [Candidatus Micrarchaeota archaeon]MDE1834595.1 hypothetical protein [Candidatus Micrarchaeota archaeon]MDE1860048.1 hypothetical protein [Candidatus Micrarchaeota archaeon]